MFFKMLPFCAAVVAVCLMGQPAGAAFTPFDDNFTEWTDDGQWGSGWGYDSEGNANWRQGSANMGRTVFDGASAINVQAYTDWNGEYIYTNRNDFDFFSDSLTVQWTIDPSATLQLPTVESSESWGYQAAALSIIDSSAVNTNDYAAGADVNIRLLESDNTDGIVDWYYLVQGQTVSMLPTMITAVYDATNITLTLQDAVFSDTLSNTYTAAHNMTAADFANGYTLRMFTVDTSRTGDDTPSSVVVDRITVTSTVPEPASMALLASGALGMIIRRRRRK